MAEKFSDITSVKATQLTIEEKRLKNNCQLKEQDINEVLESNKDLIHPEFKGWHRQQLKRLGMSRYLGLASEARSTAVSHHGKLFSKWLKQAQ